MKNRKIFSQIFPAFLGLIGLVILIFGFFGQSDLKSVYHSEIRTDLEARARLIRLQLANQDFGNRVLLDTLVKKLALEGNVRVTVIATDGRIIAESDKDRKIMDNHGDRPEIRQALQGKVGHSIRYSYTIQQDLIYTAVPLHKAGELNAIVRVAYSLARYRETLNHLRTRILFLGLTVLLLAALLSFLISRRLSKPIEEIKKGAERFAAGQFNPPLAEGGSLEISSLAGTLNKMAQDLDRRIQTISMQRSEQEAMFSSMKEGVLAVNRDQTIIRINPAAFHLLDISGESIEKRKVFEVIRHSEILQFIESALHSNEHISREISVLNDTTHTLRVTADPLLDMHGKSIGTLILINDVTHLKQLDKMRQDFVANVSHELKTPITSIKGYVETLLEEEVEDQETKRRFLNIISRHANRMDGIITDLLELSQIEQHPAGSPMLNLSEQKLQPLLDNAIEDCRKLAHERGSKITVYGNTDLLVRVNGHLIEHALINLLNNALKYSPAGSEVQLHIELDEKELRLAVRDFGNGIEAKDRERLFERFFRIDKGRSREMGGTGLGLAIVKHIALAHLGEITVDSTPGKGSTFTLHLPRT